MGLLSRSRVRRLLAGSARSQPTLPLAEQAPAATAVVPATPAVTAAQVERDEHAYEPARKLSSRASSTGAGALRQANKEPGVSFAPRFRIEPAVAQRFNAYATAAFPYEIGGMLRVERQKNGDYLATDVHVFRQAVSKVWFELDGTAVAEFNMSLFRDGKREELSEWCSLIHSHPEMTPFMSGPDRENIERLAGNKFAFSVIVSAQEDPYDNYYAVHYCQGAPLPLTIHDLPVEGHTGLSGIDEMTNNELAEIEAEVAALCSGARNGVQLRARNLASIRDRDSSRNDRYTAKRPSGNNNSWPSSNGYSSLRDNSERDSLDWPIEDEQVFDDDLFNTSSDSAKERSLSRERDQTPVVGFDTGTLSDASYEVSDDALVWAEDNDFDDVDTLLEIRGACDGERVISDTRLLLLWHKTLLAYLDTDVVLDSYEAYSLASKLDEVLISLGVYPEDESEL